ncbi:MAG: alginate export family protein [Candidatus Omnitrophica bacterium]|nr:alginate export family protein [Candidatus Omnitrophota bacterium]
MKLFRTICVLGITLCLATSVYAGTQSVKISGDLTIRALARDDFDLDQNHAEPAVPGTASAIGAGNPQPGTSDWQTWFQSAAEVQIDADLTDNVSAVLRLFNQRSWDTSVKSINTTDVTLVRGEGVSYTSDPDEFDLGLDLAYVELKEFLYSPLTLKIGRQDMWFGKGFVVGANLKDYYANINADEYTVQTSFDAIRATFDYDPWTIDAVAAKIWENEIGSKDDEDLFGVNVGYLFDSYNAEMEGYWFYKNDNQIQPTIIKQHNTVHTIGLRGSADPIDKWTASGELAMQFGDFVGFRNQQSERSRFGWAVDVSAECREFVDDFAWKPVIGTEYIFYSGDDEEYPTVATDSTFNGWDPMYRGKFDTAYREFVGKYNFTRLGWIGGRTAYVNTFGDASYTNQHQAIIYGAVEPSDSITVDGRLAFFWQQHATAYPASILSGGAPADTSNSKRKRFMGTELDLGLTWDYTEDVSFGVLAAWFFPGSFYNDEGDSVATDLVGTMKLSF